MQEKRNKFLAMTLIALLLITTVAIYLANRKAGPDVDPSIFRVDDLEAVDSVWLLSPTGKYVLHYDGARWVVNGNFRADTQMIEVLFATLAQVVPKRPVSGTMRDSVATALRNQGTKVSLFAGEQLKGEFFVGGNEQKSETYFLSSSDGPFVMSIPGYRVYVGGVFELDEGGWRDKQVFRFNQRNFRSLTTTFAKDPAQSFMITYEDRVFEVSGLNDPDTTRMFDFLDGVALLKARELYKPGAQQWVDSLLTVQPSFTLEVSDVLGRTNRLVIYPPLATQTDVVGKMGEETALFQKKDIVRIAKKKSYFQKNP